MGIFQSEEKGQGAYKQSKKAAKSYITAEGTRMGVDPNAGVIGDKYTSAFDQAGLDAQQRQAREIVASQVGQAGQWGYDPWSGRQLSLADMLQKRAMGEQPSPAEMQMRRAMGDVAADQRSMVASAGGANRALAARTASSNIARAQSDIAGQTAMLRAQEQAQAEQALAGVLGQGRGQEMQQRLGLMGFQQERDILNARMGQEASLANQQASLQQQALNDQMTQFYMSQGFTRDQAAQQAAIAVEQLAAQNYATAMGSHRQVTQGPGTQILGATIGAAGTVGAGALISDKRLKTSIKSEAKKIDEMIRKLEPYSYEYRPDDLPKGRQVGVMAQDLEKSELGKTLVVETPRGKAIDTVRGYGAVLAALRRIDDRLSSVESGKRAA